MGLFILMPLRSLMPQGVEHEAYPQELVQAYFRSDL